MNTFHYQHGPEVVGNRLSGRVAWFVCRPKSAVGGAVEQPTSEERLQDIAAAMVKPMSNTPAQPVDGVPAAPMNNVSEPAMSNIPRPDGRAITSTASLTTTHGKKESCT